MFFSLPFTQGRSIRFSGYQIAYVVTGMTYAQGNLKGAIYISRYLTHFVFKLNRKPKTYKDGKREILGRFFQDAPSAAVLQGRDGGGA